MIQKKIGKLMKTAMQSHACQLQCCQGWIESEMGLSNETIKAGLNIKKQPKMALMQKMKKVKQRKFQ